jgi:methylenetetrahydrofolate dehydrogenase (NADP+)/methenyltetrahydrofolate cyclohydrolase
MAAIRFDIDHERLREDVDVHDDGVLDGSAIAEGVEAQVADAVEAMREEADITPHLAVLRVGDDPASEVYVRQKMKCCERLDIENRDVTLPGDVPAATLQDRIRDLCEDPEIHGTLLQVPLPKHLEPLDFIEAIPASKDVDGFHPRNLGCLMSGQSDLEACTPRGIMTMLETAGVDPTGKQAVVVGRSRIVGRPMAQMLLRDDATVTVCHRHTDDLEEKVRGADILVVATGVPRLVSGDWIKPGATVVDVGITREEDGGLVGDVEFEPARERASLITPVPGGVGPMTVATLMQNTVIAACLQHDLTFVDGSLEKHT